MNVIQGLPPEVPSKTWVALDTEVFGHEGRLHRPNGTFACLSMALPDDKVYQITDQNDVPEALTRLKNASWIMQNAMYDIRQLRRWAPIPQRRIWDTMLMEQDMFGGLYTFFALDDLTRRWLGLHLDKSIRDQFPGAKKMTKPMAEYAATDSLLTRRVALAQKAWQQEEDETMRCYWEIDELAMWAIMDMGPVQVDVDAWLKAAAEFKAQGMELEQQLGINTKSPIQVKKAIKTNVGVAVKSTDKTDVLAPLRDSLEEGSKERAFMDHLLRARTYRDASSKYGAGWIEKNVEPGGLVYAGWRVTGAETGRMSCREPNLQNIPTRDMPIFRSFFIAGAGKRMIVGDVSQQEPRISAWFTKDENLLKAVRDDRVYPNVAELMGVPTWPKKDVKAVTLGSMYGLTEHGMETKYGIPKDEGKKKLQKFFNTFRGVRVWITTTRIHGERIGYVRTATGRRCWLNPYSYQAKNNAINSPIQGTAADMTKLSLVVSHKESPLQGLPFSVRMVIHDEKVSVAPEPGDAFERLEMDSWIEAGRRVIPGVPIETKVYIGSHWGAKHDD